MKFLIVLAAVAVRVSLKIAQTKCCFKAANAWDPKKTFLPKNEVEALSCKNGKDSLADGQEV